MSTLQKQPDTATDPTAGHTPTPWCVGHHFPDAVYNSDRSRGIAECCDERLPFDQVSVGDSVVNRANAAIIVRAVNAHDALIETLRVLRVGVSRCVSGRSLDIDGKGHACCACYNCTSAARIDRALALAKVGAP